MQARQAEVEEAARSFGLSRGEEQLPVSNKVKILREQIVRLDDSIDSLRKSQDALSKMSDIYARDADAQADAKIQLDKAKQKLAAMVLNRSRVQLLLDQLLEEAESAEE